MSKNTLYDKVWDSHTVAKLDSGQDQIFIGLHLIHEVTTPQAFGMLKEIGAGVAFPDRTMGTVDHIIPTLSQIRPYEDEQAEKMMAALEQNVNEFGVRFLHLDTGKQGIVHVIGPELGVTQPGMTIVCGDSHTSTHGAFGALAFGIGTSEVGYVLATQCLMQDKAKTFAINVEGSLGLGITAKDIILAIIAKNGAAGGVGHVFEYRGEAIRALDMASRMTICNMSIEGGARAGLIAPDDTPFAYLKGRPRAPQGADWDAAVAQWRGLVTDPGATYDTEIVLDASQIAPQVTWGTSPQDVLPITGAVPDPATAGDEATRQSMVRSLEYMGLEAGTPLAQIAIDRVFIGSCTNGRIEDLRAVAEIAKGRKVAATVDAMVVPGSGLVKRQAEAEGIDKVLVEAGFDWREPGCSMCLAMNADKLAPGERCASTSNRNFEGRQGPGGRTHLMSPVMAAAAAIAGRLADVRKLD